MTNIADNMETRIWLQIHSVAYDAVTYSDDGGIRNAQDRVRKVLRVQIEDVIDPIVDLLKSKLNK